MQFSLKWAFVAPLVVGLLIWALSPRGYSLYWVVALRVVLFLFVIPVLLLIVQGGRRSRAFGLGALCPALTGVALAAMPLFHGPKGGNLQGLVILASRNLTDGGSLADIQFQVGFLVALGVLCGTVALGVSSLIGQTRKP